MKRIGIFLIGFGTASALFLRTTSPDQRLDSTALLIIAGAYFLTYGVIVDKLTSQHSETTIIRSNQND